MKSFSLRRIALYLAATLVALPLGALLLLQAAGFPVF